MVSPFAASLLDGAPGLTSALQTRARAATVCVDWLLMLLDVHATNDALVGPVRTPPVNLE
jgi:hypothetical protein